MKLLYCDNIYIFFCKQAAEAKVLRIELAFRHCTDSCVSFQWWRKRRGRRGRRGRAAARPPRERRAPAALPADLLAHLPRTAAPPAAPLVHRLRGEGIPCYPVLP